ncbi:MAG TPA: PqqD family protein [Solirubrobacteraceae bacterium]|nr:PqqD family protein [Solirubrobacteraceae bacterium]
MTVLRLRTDDLFWRESGREIVGLDAATSRYFSANPSAAALWERLREGATAADLADALCERYGVSRDLAEADVAKFVDQLSARGLLDP